MVFNNTEVKEGANPDVQIASLVKDLYGSNVPAQPNPTETVDASKPTLETEIKQPSMAQYLDAVQTRENTNQKKNPYSETLNTDALGELTKPDALMSSKLTNLKNNTPEERAKIGSDMGGGIGLAMNGVIGGVIGSGIGAMGARALGQVQSGKQQEATRNNRVLDVFKTVGIADDKGRVKFDDGDGFVMTANPNIRLTNVSDITMPEKTRATTQVDISNPFTKRSVKAVKPMAYFVNEGLLGWRNADSPSDTIAFNNTVGLLTNSIQHGADDIKTVYGRAKQLASKLGLTEQVARDIMQQKKSQMSEDEIADVEEGLGILYG